MSQSSYDLKNLEIKVTAITEELKLRGERHFTFYDMETARAGKWSLAACAFVAGLLLATVVMHFLK